jgi:hypothetical protein
VVRFIVHLASPGSSAAVTRILNIFMLNNPTTYRNSRPKYPIFPCARQLPWGERGIPVATDKQIAANRLNALKSTGPKTPEGRAAVRLNGVKHGLHAQTLVLKGESESDFAALLESYEAEHAPATPTEEALVQQLVMATWRLRRLYHAEAGYYAHRMEDTADRSKDYNLDHSGHMGLVVDWSNKTLDAFNRQQAHLERSFCRALRELKRLRAERKPKLASVPQPTLVVRQINDIQPPPDPEIPAPTPKTVETPQSTDPPATER